MDEMSRSVGEIKGRLDTLESNMNDKLRELKDAIDSISAVPQALYDERRKLIDDELTQHEASIKTISKRISDINDRLTRRESSLSWKVADFFDNAIVKAVGGGFIVIAIISLWATYQNQIKDIEAQLRKTTEIVTSSEDK